MRTVRSESQQDVARANLFPVDDLIPFHDADGAAGQVIPRSGVKARHLGRFSAQKRTAAFHAGLGDAGHHFRRHAGVQPSGRDVIEEKKGFGPVCQNIVHTHGDQIPPRGGVSPRADQEIELCAHAVHAGDEDRRPAPRRDPESAAEPSDRSLHLRAAGGFGQLPQTRNQRVGGLDIDARPTVGQAGFGPIRIFRSGHAV